MPHTRLLGGVLPLLLLLSQPVSAQSVYNVEIDTSAVKGSAGKVVFALTSNRTKTNRVDIFNFTTDGTLGTPETTGGQVAGDLIESKIPAALTRIAGGSFFNELQLNFALTSNRTKTNRVDIFNFTTDGTLATPETTGGQVAGDLIESKIPAPLTRIAGGSFFNELQLNFAPFGKRVFFSINVSESAASDGRPVDQFALYLLDEEGNPLIPMRVGRENRKNAQGNPVFTVTISGERGGELEVLGQQIDRRRRGQIEADDPDRDLRRAHFTITPAWVSVDEENANPTITLEGVLAEFCTRRCEGAPTCAGGEFGINFADDEFLRFDDVGNLKTRVSLIESGKTVEGGDEDNHATVRVRVVGSLLTDKKLIVREVKVQ